MKIYLSIPITGRDYQAQKAKADEAAKRLRAACYEVANPFEKGGESLDADYAELMGEDIKELLRSDRVLFLEDPEFDSNKPGYSREVDLEWQCAFTYDIEMHYSLDNLLALADYYLNENK